jgi:hypothetical protein
MGRESSTHNKQEHKPVMRCRENLGRIGDRVLVQRAFGMAGGGLFMMKEHRCWLLSFSAALLLFSGGWGASNFVVVTF